MMDWLEKFEKYIHSPGVDAKMNPPATFSNLDGFETWIAGLERIVPTFTLPPSYASFLNLFNGGYAFDSSEPCTFVKFLSIDQENDIVISIWEANGEDCPLVNGDVDFWELFLPLVVFAADEGGNVWAFDPRDQDNKGEMPVRFCELGSGNVYDQATDFTAFILAIVDRSLVYREWDAE